MTHLGNHELPPQKANRGMPPWLVVAVTSLAFSAPVAGLSLLAWPFVLLQPNVIVVALSWPASRA